MPKGTPRDASPSVQGIYSQFRTTHNIISERIPSLSAKTRVLEPSYAEIQAWLPWQCIFSENMLQEIIITTKEKLAFYLVRKMLIHELKY